METNEKGDKTKKDEEIKLKDEEIQRLTCTRKISVENGIRLHEKNRKLESEIKELKEKKGHSSTKNNLPYPCDKCDSNFKTPGLLLKHVKSNHGNQ